MIQVYTAAFCGMLWPHGEFESMADACERATTRRQWLAKQGCDITTLSPTSWEIGEPSNCQLIPDYCGILKIRSSRQTD